MGNCQSCGAELLPNAKFCHECGTPVARPTFDCPTCKTSNPLGARFCQGCGQAFLGVDPPTATPVAAPVPEPAFEPEPFIDFTDEPEVNPEFDSDIVVPASEDESEFESEPNFESEFVESKFDTEVDPEDGLASDSEKDEFFTESEKDESPPAEPEELSLSDGDFWDSLVETKKDSGRAKEVEFEWSTEGFDDESAQPDETEPTEITEPDTAVSWQSEPREEVPEVPTSEEVIESEEVPVVKEPIETEATETEIVPETEQIEIFTPEETAEPVRPPRSSAGLVRNIPPDLEPPPTLRKLQVKFGEMFEWRVKELNPRLNKYRDRAVESGFLETVEQRFPQILTEILPLDPPERRRFVERTFAELMDYFLAGHCADLNPVDLPAAVMRYQGIPVTADNLFRIVYDYLELEREREPFYIDFVKMPTKKLRRAAKSFLFARPEERILLILDQTLLGSVKEGFAFTDRALYWKPHLEPAASVDLVDLQELKREHDWLRINGKFFHVSRPVNLKMLYLLRKIKRDGIGS